MSNIFDFGEAVEGYDIKVLNEREARAGAGILFLAGFISFINCMVMENLFVTKIFVSVFLIEFIIEFIIRVLINPKFAPSLIIGRFMVNNQVPEYVGAAQKRFAWSIGLALAVFLLGLTIIFPSPTPAGEESLHNALVGLTCMTCLVFLYFEAVFGICLGCKIYHTFYKKKAQYCAGEVCENKDRQACQKHSTSQIVILIMFFVVLILSIASLTS